MKTTPHLLDELVKLTSIRDAELLEYSLLRTIQEILSPTVLSLFRLSANGQPCYQMVCDAEHGPRVVAEPVVSARTLEVAAECMGLRQGVRRRLDDGQELSVYPVVELRGFTTYLEVVDRFGDAKEDARLIDGFLRFYENYCGLLDYSQRDQLTGLMNRKTFDESVFKLFSSGDRFQLDAASPRAKDDRRIGAHRGEFWLGMVDIDHFKRINDSFGHLYGDEVLLLASQVMQRGFRDTDLLFRFGGEEFVIITQNVDRDGALHVFERLRQSIESFRFPQVGQVTISIGLVQLVPGKLTPILLDQADKALYYAKQHGRNQVAVYQDLVERGDIDETQHTQGSVDLF
ncbi:GGDEF domain-containing protein [Pseudomarimonas arenosa]|uniref:diguanylate cyclase n=1 Tax=Pseudomarimonas arenosa TaxID=2774145 RepID=A0AAW3ZLC7_9GAMM|nr:GGDEF domain-containing protein [Pseudomarimonas arenosa]MBD8526265.1 GGDEF domain-containing protein [Pseudomarimonas arenosa]